MKVLSSTQRKFVLMTFSGTPEPSLYTIKSIMILDNDGERIVAKYYDENGRDFQLLCEVPK